MNRGSNRACGRRQDHVARERQVHTRADHRTVHRGHRRQRRARDGAAHRRTSRAAMPAGSRRSSTEPPAQNAGGVAVSTSAPTDGSAAASSTAWPSCTVTSSDSALRRAGSSRVTTATLPSRSSRTLGSLPVHGPSIARRGQNGPMEFLPSDEVTAIRARLDHPIIDADGHAIEYLPLVRDILREQAGDDAVAVMDLVTGGARGDARAHARSRCVPRVSSARRGGGSRHATRSTAAPRCCPICSRRACPSSASTTRSSTRPTGWCRPRSTTLSIRLPLARAFNTFYAEAFRDHRETLTPVGIIPMHTPEEAIAELDHATGELGLKAFMFGGPISRPAPGVDPPSRAARWLDSLGLDSLYDYDPVWQRCVDLGVSPTFHTAAMGWTIRASVDATTCSTTSACSPSPARCSRSRCSWAACRSGSRSCASRSRRAGWRGRRRCSRTSIGHWEKRNRDAVEHYNPAHLDRAQVASLFEEYGSPRYRERLDQLDDGLRMLSLPDEDPATLDEFAPQRHHRRRRHPRRVHPGVPLRVRGRRSHDRARPSTRAAPAGDGSKRSSRPTSGTGTSPTSARCSRKRGSWWRTATPPRPTSARSPSSTRCRCGPTTNPSFFDGTSVEGAVRDELERVGAPR